MQADELLADPKTARLIQLALEEDGCTLDVTSQCLVPSDARATAALVAREPGVVAGLVLLREESPLRAAFPHLEVEFAAEDGHRARASERLARVFGPARDVLAIERTLLNFVQRLSGIATETARYVAETAGTAARIQETRKTCPGHRDLDKYAVRVGGGLNHRRSLSDQVLVKENHLVHADFPPGVTGPARIAAAVALARSRMPRGMILEIEVETLAEFDAALDAGPDVVMLDDFDDADIATAVARRAARAKGPLIEVSGGVRLERIARLAALGVDRISVGALTHSVRALDLALKIVPGPPR